MTHRPTAPDATRAPRSLRTSSRAVTAAGPLVARRRAAADRGMLVLLGLLLGAVVVAALAAPRMVNSVADDGIRFAVQESRPSSDLVARLDPGAGTGAIRDDAAAERTVVAARDLDANLPPELADVLGEPGIALTAFAWPARPEGVQVVGRLGYAGSDVVRWVDGRAPEASPQPELADDAPVASLARRVEVGVTARAARELGFSPGDEIRVGGLLVTQLTAVVTGTYEVVDPAQAQWVDLPEFVAPTPGPANTDSVAGVGFLTTDASLPDLLAAVQPSAATLLVRFPADAPSLTAAEGPEVAATATGLVADPTPLTVGDGRVPSVTTELPAVLESYASRLAGATAQASVVMLGLVTAGGLVLVLAARLLTMRRRRFLDVERARGAAVASVGWRALLESVPLTALAATAGALLTWALLPSGRGTPWPAVLVVLTGVLAPPLLAATAVIPAWAGRRVPANRADRERAARQRRTRRLVAELAVLALAAAAFFSVRARGLRPTRTGDVDWLLAATPVLLAAAATLLVVHLLPPVVRAAARTAVRGTGVAALVATRRAVAGSRTAIPALTTTVAVALVVFCGVTSTTVDRGQERAADLVVQADVRLDGPVPDEAVAALRAAPGVVAAAGATRLEGRTFGIGSGISARLLAVDAEQLAAVRAALGADDDGLAALAAADGGTRVPALVSPSLLSTARTLDPHVWVREEFAPLEVLGTTSITGSAEPTATVVVDRSALEAATGSDLQVDTVWVAGPGATEAVAASGLASTGGVAVLSRSDWLDAWQLSPLTAGLRSLLGAAALALALLAGIALLLTVVATSRDRRATVNVLRTLGASERTGSRIAAVEVLPTAIAALLAGSVIGVAVPWLLTSALGLGALTGEPSGTRVVVTWQPFALAVVAVVVAIAAATQVEAWLRRHDDLAGAIREAER
ncbi:hypothetical protein KIN34_00865 [Cellulomonas sp. DKR-3]|uniref:ABC3 transporter permease C-terminal domain-containing protein n=1 Tax=Cellulomonas fulva TaxID=2835530 RepID=A0ABS5TUN3_9CELL|nr:FtsX-like permease family protein [Cellulomonas fulva]MBT0992843.1 hypothetical protein [Cellulomonas fulva]